tara:strand:+ start:355 stop:627 length:273 start_codon:yes stop_codon:yes gene_type:complete
MSDYKNGYRSEVPRYKLVSIERKEYEEYIETRDLVDLASRIERGEPHEVNPNYGGQGYTYLYPETRDLGRLKVTPVDDTWKLEWENQFNG